MPDWQQLRLNDTRMPMKAGGSRGRAVPPFRQLKHRTVIVMEPDDAARAELTRLLRPYLWRVVETGGSAAAVHAAHLEEHAGCVVLARFEAGAAESHELARRLAAFAPASNFLVFLVDGRDAALISEAYAAGAADVLVTPPCQVELAARIEQAFRFLELERFRKQVGDDSSLIADMSTASIVHSRVYLESELGKEVKRATRYDHPLALILAEVAMEYDAAEGALRASGRCLSEQIRQDIDWIARYNRESFAVVLPETGVEDSHAAARRLAKNARSMDPKASGIPCETTWTFGFTGFDQAGPECPDVEDLLASAETYLAAARTKSSRRIAGGAATPRG